MIKTIAILLMFSAAGLYSASDPAGFHVWKAADIEAHSKALAPKMDAFKVASETVATEGNRSFIVAHREGAGQAEWHEKQADVIIIESGTVTLTYGGSVVDGKTTAPGEIRGASIDGGTQIVLGAGDVLHIPAKVPHQMKVPAGKKLTYVAVKVNE